jgi:protease-4
MSEGPFGNVGSGPSAATPLSDRPAPAPRGRRSIWATLATILLVLSALGNLALLVLLGLVFGLVESLGGADSDGVREHVLEKGTTRDKVAVIRIEGIIDEYMVEEAKKQITRASQDKRVKAVILQINSPGGGLTASDTLHHLLKTDLEEKPIVASMDSVAASGGYYVACAAKKIVAQPTTITGSIGVIGHVFFVNELMKDKLGVVPVTIKMGEQKDWPNMFTQRGLPQEQHQYLMDTFLVPGYEKFLEVVRQARGYEEAEARRVATGRAFMAPEAKDLRLVDEIGYFERAVELAQELAGISGAKVVEYRRIPTLADLLVLESGAKQVFSLSPEKIAGLGGFRVMYLWTGY